MEQYIPKDAVVAEIKRRIKTNKECMLGLKKLDYYQGKADALNDTISLLDTLEVKGVDLENDIQNVIHNHFFDLNGIAIVGTSSYATVDDMVYIAKHFFELGVKAQKGDNEI